MSFLFAYVKNFLYVCTMTQNKIKKYKLIYEEYEALEKQRLALQKKLARLLANTTQDDIDKLIKENPCLKKIL